MNMLAWSERMVFNTVVRRIAGYCAVVFLLFISGDVLAQETQEPKRGRYLYTEVERTEDIESFRMTLRRAPGSVYPVMKFSRQLRRMLHEVKVYEAIENVKSLLGTTTRVLPNRFIKEGRSVREVLILGNPLPYTSFKVGTQSVITNGQGEYTDDKQIFLSLFDDLTSNSVDVKVSHFTLGTQTVTFTRNIIFEEPAVLPTYKKEDPKATMDVLESLGLNYIRTTNLGRVPLDVAVEIPEVVEAGKPFIVKVTVSNPGPSVAGNVICGSFSRVDWLDGKLFYFGSLKPGEKATFTRIYHAPTTPGPVPAHVLFSSWDIVKAQPERGKMFVVKVRQ